MSTDPYHAVQQEIQTSLQTGSQLLSSYIRIRNMARDDSEELMWARNELKATLAALEADLEALEESVKVVETTGPRMFGLDDAEVQERRKYISHVQKELENMRAELAAAASSSHSNKPPFSRPGSGTATSTSYPYTSSRHSDAKSSSSYALADMDHNAGAREGAKEDHQAAWAAQEQQMMIHEQDKTMDHIAGALSTLAQQAGLMGQEISEHNELLTDLEQNVERTDTKLNDAMRRMRKFLRDSEEKGSAYCIVFLIIILMALLLAVILI
ncbi:hypothetical protein AX17_002556 [Amanita inopinata Kibby_2008]|nr:hypothetical protein AX17_002556 [Amanita inopinata Kibby_2008]